MNLRIKLLVGFWALALSALTFFGFIAYDTTEQASAEKESALLRGVFANVATEIETTITKSRDMNETLTRMSAAYGDHISITLQDDAGKVLHSIDFGKQLTHLAGRTTKEKEGQFIDPPFYYSWGNYSAKINQKKT